MSNKRVEPVAWLAEASNPGVPEGMCPNCREGWLEECEPGEEYAGELSCPLCGVCYTEACNTCEREIYRTEAPALCRSCEGAARAHGRHDGYVQRAVRDGWTDKRGRAL